MPRTKNKRKNHESSKKWRCIYYDYWYALNVQFVVVHIVSENGTKRFHINPQLCSNMDMINEMFVHYACSGTLINPEITSSYFFFIVKLQFSLWLHCKNDSYEFFYKNVPNHYMFENPKGWIIIEGYLTFELLLCKK